VLLGRAQQPVGIQIASGVELDASAMVDAVFFIPVQLASDTIGDLSGPFYGCQTKAQAKAAPLRGLVQQAGVIRLLGQAQSLFNGKQVITENVGDIGVRVSQVLNQIE